MFLSECALLIFIWNVAESIESIDFEHQIDILLDPEALKVHRIVVCGLMMTTIQLVTNTHRG